MVTERREELNRILNNHHRSGNQVSVYLYQQSNFVSEHTHAQIPLNQQK